MSLENLYNLIKLGSPSREVVNNALQALVNADPFHRLNLKRLVNTPINEHDAALNLPNQFPDINVDYHNKDGHGFNRLRRNNKQTLLMAAVCANNVEVVELLLEKGARINGCYSGALVRAIETENTEMVKLLLERGAKPIYYQGDDNECPVLLAAVNSKNIEILQLILDADFITRDDEGNYRKINITDEYVFEDVTRKGPLSCACANDNIPIVKLLMEYGADITSCHGSDFSSPLFYAVEGGNLEMIKFVFEANEEVAYDRMSGAAANGESPFTLALENGKPEIIQFVLERCDTLLRENDDSDDRIFVGAEKMLSHGPYIVKKLSSTLKKFADENPAYSKEIQNRIIIKASLTPELCEEFWNSKTYLDWGSHQDMVALESKNKDGLKYLPVETQIFVATFLPEGETKNSILAQFSPDESKQVSKKIDRLREIKTELADHGLTLEQQNIAIACKLGMFDDSKNMQYYSVMILPDCPLKKELVSRLDPYDKKTVSILEHLKSDLLQGRDNVGYREMGEKVMELISHPQRENFVAAICKTDFLKAAESKADQVFHMPELASLIFEFVGGKNIPGQDKESRAEEARKFRDAALKYYGIKFPDKPALPTAPQVQNNNFNDLPPAPPEDDKKDKKRDRDEDGLQLRAARRLKGEEKEMGPSTSSNPSR